jgi:GNAT superfamily N-acetyltransferase
MPDKMPDTIAGMASELEYRVGFSVDDRTLSELHARAFAYPAEPPSVRVQPWASRLNRYSLAWVGAFHEDDLVGFVHACWDGGLHAFLLDTVIDPHHRRGGAGTKLVLILADEVRRAGCEWLHVDYPPHLDSFYRSCGFRATTAGLIQLG